MKNIITFCFCLLFFFVDGQTKISTSWNKRTFLSFDNEQLENRSQLLRYYALSSYQDAVSPTVGRFGSTFISSKDSVTNTRLISMYNLSLLEMITHFVGRENDVFLISKSPFKYYYLPRYGSKESWMIKNSKCFEIMFPNGVIESMDVVDSLIYQLFNIEVYKQKMKIPTNILSRTSKMEKFKYQDNFKSKDTQNGRFVNVTFSEFGKMLTDVNRPFLDETGYFGMIDIELKGIKDWNDINSINKLLNKYDLQIKTEIREKDMLVIKERSCNK